jgi:hypothetical protein
MGVQQRLIVGQVGDPRREDDLVDRGDDLGVVALYPAALGQHHPAVRVAGIDPLL